MNKRKVIILFLSAMTMSIIVMVIVYGVFIKDIDFSFNVKNPESAPSPVDAFDRGDSDSGTSNPQGPAKVTTPDDSAKTPNPDEAAANTPADNTEAKSTTSSSQPPLPDVLPLKPQTDNNDDSNPPVPDAPGPAPDTQKGMLDDNDNATPSIHLVYLDGFSNKASADEAIQQLQSRSVGPQPYIRQYHGKIILQFGVFNDKANAEEMAQQLRNQNVFVKVD